MVGCDVLFECSYLGAADKDLIATAASWEMGCTPDSRLAMVRRLTPRRSASADCVSLRPSRKALYWTSCIGMASTVSVCSPRIFWPRLSNSTISAWPIGHDSLAALLKTSTFASSSVSALTVQPCWPLVRLCGKSEYSGAISTEYVFILVVVLAAHDGLRSREGVGGNREALDALQNRINGPRCQLLKRTLGEVVLIGEGVEMEIATRAAFDERGNHGSMAHLGAVFWGHLKIAGGDQILCNALGRFHFLGSFGVGVTQWRRQDNAVSAQGKQAKRCSICILFFRLSNADVEARRP